MNWYIGQEIVCVRTSKNALVLKGRHYFISGLKRSDCSCPKINIDVGIVGELHGTYCGSCGEYFAGEGREYWFTEELFAPLADISELKEILEKQPETQQHT